ncbi:hypothetical protein [Pseudolysinimonas sp.]|uniref:hypothetical protein n=1 Tax=Pseudolysinimonas sp. TaxID=2680009 RepID=UPI003F7D1220
MTDIRELLRRYDALAAERADYNAAEETAEPATASEWERNDEQFVLIADELAAAIREHAVLTPQALADLLTDAVDDWNAPGSLAERDVDDWARKVAAQAIAGDDIDTVEEDED